MLIHICKKEKRRTCGTFETNQFEHKLCQDRRAVIDSPVVDLAGLVKTCQIDSRSLFSRPLYSTPDEKNKSRPGIGNLWHTAQQGKQPVGQGGLFTCSVHRFGRSQLPLAGVVHLSSRLARLPAAPIGLDQRTAASGTCNWLNLRTLQSVRGRESTVKGGFLRIHLATCVSFSEARPIR
ncbi:hypothetical protein UY3_07073 [Chelonia mydas]|uniref:Uncharacterized protein n=1 Tax=Chelonia mydas TaxID=8469 RepID=M7BD49_CHEMY|nr:hypothetical protein UY3_07073 [Chelonia mydas]